MAVVDSVPTGKRGAATAPAAMTIGGLAQAAGVGVETVRYYQRRGLLPAVAPILATWREWGYFLAPELLKAVLTRAGEDE